MFKIFEQPLESRMGNERKESEQKTRILVMLGARFHQEGYGNEYPPQFPLILESQKEGMPKEVVGGDVRMRAIEQLYKEFEKENNGGRLKIFTTGGIEKVTVPDSDEPLQFSRAEKAEQKLEIKYGIPDEIVETLPSGGSTLGNAATLAEWIRTHQETVGDVQEIEIVTNEFHMPRAWLMFSLAVYKNETGKDFAFDEELITRIEKVLDETLTDKEAGDQIELQELQSIIQPYLENLPLKIKPQIAEDILKRRGTSGEKYGELIRRNEFLQETRGFERQGIKDLINGKYQVK